MNIKVSVDENGNLMASVDNRIKIKAAETVSTGLNDSNSPAGG